MWYDFYEFVHSSMGMHFWDLPTIIVGVLIIVMLVVHTLNQKKREDRFDKERAEKLEALQKEGPGEAQQI